jgi:hypothetical protein
MKQFTLVLVALFLLIVSPQISFAQEQDKPDLNKFGFFIEFGPHGIFPVGGDEMNRNWFGFTFGAPADIDPGAGFQLALGLDTKYFAIGPKVMVSLLDIDDPIFGFGFIEGENLLVWNSYAVNIKLYLLDILQIDSGRFRPYFYGDPGYGFQVGGSVFPLSSGFDFNTGLGFQWLVARYFYMAFEGGYHGSFVGNDCSPIFDLFNLSSNLQPNVCRSGNLHTATASMNFGFRF